MQIQNDADQAGIWIMQEEMALENEKFPDRLVRIQRKEIKARPGVVIPDECFRSKRFLVQIVRKDKQSGFCRMTIGRTMIDDKGAWEQDITWDDIQRLKSEAGYGDRWAVEVFPAEGNVVNVANLRHIWLLDERPPYAWNRDSEVKK